MDSLNLDLTGAAPEPKEPFQAQFYKGKPEYAGPFYTINIAHVEHLPDFEVIGVNGEVLQIRRGENVHNIPQAFIEVLQNAIASRQVKHQNTDRTEYFTWQPFPAIPYQIIGPPYDTRK